MQQENWRPVTSFSNYMISDLGNVKNIKFNRILKYYYSEGYPQVSLSQDGTRSVRRVHLLVADEFIPNPLNLPIVNHLDGNKFNPMLSNLERCTHKHNTQHAVKTGLMRPHKIFKNNKSSKYKVLGLLPISKLNVKIVKIYRKLNT